MNDAQWRAFQQDWYKSGRRYREFAGMFGSHSQIFRRWFSHPTYDSFWRKMVPYREQFARINSRADDHGAITRMARLVRCTISASI